VERTYHIVIKKEYASAIIEDLRKLDAVEVLSDSAFQVPQWQIDEIRSRRAYYKLHPDELIDWDEAQKMIKTD
jgi:Putative addiction module component